MTGDSGINLDSYTGAEREWEIRKSIASTQTLQASVQVDEQQSRWFRIDEGVWQGSPLSPNSCIVSILWEWSKSWEEKQPSPLLLPQAQPSNIWTSLCMQPHTDTLYASTNPSSTSNPNTKLYMVLNQTLNI